MEQIRKYFDQVYNETYDKTLAYILTKCGRKDVVEDILQEVYLELLKVLEQKKVHYIKSPEGFVLQLAKSKVYRYYSEREQQVVCDYVEELEESAVFDANRNAAWEDVLIDQLTAKEVMEYLAEKDELTKEIFYQHFFENKTIKEIAKIQGVKEFTVKNRLYRTLKELKGMKRFAVIAGILLLAALLAKPVYTLAEDAISKIKHIQTYIERSHYSKEELDQLAKEFPVKALDDLLDSKDWSSEVKEKFRNKVMELIDMLED